MKKSIRRDVEVFYPDGDRMGYFCGTQTGINTIVIEWRNEGHREVGEVHMIHGKWTLDTQTVEMSGFGNSNPNY